MFSPPPYLEHPDMAPVSILRQTSKGSEIGSSAEKSVNFSNDPSAADVENGNNGNLHANISSPNKLGCSFDLNDARVAGPEFQELTSFEPHRDWSNNRTLVPVQQNQICVPMLRDRSNSMPQMARPLSIITGTRTFRLQNRLNAKDANVVLPTVELRFVGP